MAQAVAGTLHNVMNGLLDELDASLMDNDELLGRVAAYNTAQNQMKNGTREYTYYLLSQAAIPDLISIGCGSLTRVCGDSPGRQRASG